MTMANGWSWLRNSLRGSKSKSPKTKPQDFLKYKIDGEKSTPRALTDETASLLARLIKQSKVPARIAGNLKLLTEVKEQL